MADAIALLIIFILVLAGSGVIVRVARKSARERKQLPGKITRKREKALKDLDDLIRRINQAATVEELDSLEGQEKRKDQ